MRFFSPQRHGDAEESRVLFDKACFEVGCGDHAFVFFAKELIAVVGDEVVDEIADEAWQDFEDAQCRPGCGEMTHDLEDSGAALQDLALADHHDAIEIIRIVSGARQFIARVAGLQRCKPEFTCGITPDQELHESIAEIAYAIKKYYDLVSLLHERYGASLF